MISKRGVSAVVATVLLIFLTVAAATVLTGIIIPFVKDNLVEGTKCFPYKDYFTFQEKFSSSTGDKLYNCYMVDGSNVLYGASVKAQSVTESEEVTGFRIVFEEDELASSSSFIVSSDEPQSESDGIKILGDSLPANLRVPGPGNTITYVFTSTNSASKYRNIIIYPILSSGKVCDISDSIKLIPCQTGPSGVDLSI